MNWSDFSANSRFLWPRRLLWYLSNLVRMSAMTQGRTDYSLVTKGQRSRLHKTHFVTLEFIRYLRKNLAYKCLIRNNYDIMTFDNQKVRGGIIISSGTETRLVHRGTKPQCATSSYLHFKPTWFLFKIPAHVDCMVKVCSRERSWLWKTNCVLNYLVLFRNRRLLRVIKSLVTGCRLWSPAL